MNKIARRLHETFGDPIGEVPGITKVGAVGARTEVKPCPHCGQLPIDGNCGCGESCSACKMLPIDGSCGCGSRLSEATEMEPCSECGMYEIDGTCECWQMDEVAPPGKEDMVKALKKEPGVRNPYAVAWAAHNKEKQGR